jgi:hypothetical protein
MESAMKPALLALFLALPASAAVATDLTATGPNGGTYAGTRSCSNADSARTCYGAGTYTSPQGRVSTRSGTSILTKGSWTYDGVVKRPSGRTVHTSIVRKR